MKTLLVIFVLLLAGWQVDCRVVGITPKQLGPDQEACVTELNLNREKITAINTFHILPEDNNDFNAFMGCVGKKKGLITSNGEISFENILQEMLKGAKKEPAAYQLFKQIMTSVVENCQANPPSGSTEGQTLIKALNCVIRGAFNPF